MEINTLYEILDLNSKGDSLDQSRSNSKLFIKKAFQDEELEDLDLKSVLEHIRLVKEDITAMLEFEKPSAPVNTLLFLFTSDKLINSLLKMKKTMIGKNITETLDIFISILNKEVEKENKIEAVEDYEIDEVLYEKKIASSGEVTFFANGKPLTTALIEEDLMKEVESLVDLITHIRRFTPEELESYFDSNDFFSIELDTNFGGCTHNIGGYEHANCFYYKKIHPKEIKNLSRKKIVEFIKKDLKAIKVEDLELPWIEIK